MQVNEGDPRPMVDFCKSPLAHAVMRAAWLESRQRKWSRGSQKNEDGSEARHNLMNFLP